MSKYDTLDEWLDEWEAAVEAGQSAISRAEAIRRFHIWQDENDDGYSDEEALEMEREDHRRIKEARG